MRTRFIGSFLAAALVAAAAACADGSPTAANAAAPARPRLDADPVVTTQYHDFECDYERGGDIWVSVDRYARDVYTWSDNSVTYGEVYFVDHWEYDTGPTAGIGQMWCEQYDGTNF